MTESRRGFLRKAIGRSAAGALVMSGLAVPRRLAAQSKLTPDTALKELMDGTRDS